MDRINGLSDDLLVKILLFLPTEDAVSTSVLSKRWEHLWMWLPKLDFDDGSYPESKCKRLKCFLERNLPLHKATVIESLRLQFLYYCTVCYKSEDVKQWIAIAVSRQVRELEISFSCYDNQNILPSNLYSCESLVVLKLEGEFLLDVPPMVSLPCLKTLELRDIAYSNQESLQCLLSNCPILEDLLVEFGRAADMRKFSIIVPSLLSLSLYTPDYEGFVIDEFVINTPSLKYFKLEDTMSEPHSCVIENMPKLREAYVDVNDELSNTNTLIRSIKSVKSLTLCVKWNAIENVCDDGFVFDELEHLKLCACQEFGILVSILKHCPNLQELGYFGIKEHCYNFVTRFEEPTMVPECLSKLRIFNWFGSSYLPYLHNLSGYILKNAYSLKKGTISTSGD